jgi:hypothetical protein
MTADAGGPVTSTSYVRHQIVDVGVTVTITVTKSGRSLLLFRRQAGAMKPQLRQPNPALRDLCLTCVLHGALPQLAA